MTDSWVPRETTVHQDHVIAHVLGATVLGYFVFDEVLYIVLDIGFVWTIFLDGEMGLLPHPVAISELQLDEQSRREIKADTDLLLGDNRAAEKLLRIKPAPGEESPITEVELFELEDRRRLLLGCEAATLAIETSLTTGEILVYECEP